MIKQADMYTSPASDKIVNKSVRINNTPLTIRHDAGSSAQPYVDGALLAIRKVSSFVGLRRGLDSALDLA